MHDHKKHATILFSCKIIPAVWLCHNFHSFITVFFSVPRPQHDINTTLLLPAQLINLYVRYAMDQSTLKRGHMFYEWVVRFTRFTSPVVGGLLFPRSFFLKGETESVYLNTTAYYIYICRVANCYDCYETKYILHAYLL